MKQLLAMILGLAFATTIGCGPQAGPRDTATVEVTASVTGPDGKPLSKSLHVILQPSGDTLGGRLEATVDGKFTGKVAPGSYVYFVKMAKSETPPKGIPAKFTEPNADNKVEVTSGKPLEIKLSN